MDRDHRTRRIEELKALRLQAPLSSAEAEEYKRLCDEDREEHERHPA